MGNRGEREKESGLQFSLLGSFAATLDGKRLDSFRTAKVQALLIYLLMQPLEGGEGRVAREQMMALLWPEKGDDRARDNLRQALYHLRKSIPDVRGPSDAPVPFVISDRQQIWINPDAGYSLDVTRFLCLVEGDSHADLEEAVELYRGDFLADFYLEDSSAFENWVAEWRAQLRRQMLEVLGQLAAELLEQGDPEAGLRYARRQLALDNLRESAHRQTMLGLSRLGRRPEAIRQYERARTLLEEELGVAPSRQTEMLARAVREGHAAQNAPMETAGRQGKSRRRAKLPASATPLIGREVELAEVRALLRDGTRLVSIVGPGGIGKTHLALEVAHRHAGDYDYGAAFVDLTPLSDSAAIFTAIATALDFRFTGEGTPQEQILNYLSDKELLLVLDNAEHLFGQHRPDGAPLLNGLLQAAAGVHLLVTSRERLKLRAEHLYPLAGLAYSQGTTPVEAGRQPAAHLFLHHARRVRPAFVLRRAHLEPLEEIVRSTEGMPLALILAAGWITVMSPTEIAVELGRSLDFLKATHRDVPERQRSMRAVFDTTWQRMSARERAVFSALSVFRGGFTLAAARTVAAAAPHDLLRLADRSLLARGEEGRFAVHELLRQFAAEKLQSRSEEQAVRDAHSTYYLQALAERLPDLKGGDQLGALRVIERDFENVRAAWRWAVLQRQWQHFTEAGKSIFLFSLFRSRYHDGIEFCRVAERSLPGDKDHPYLAAIRSMLLLSVGEKEEALAGLAVLRTIVRTSDDLDTVAYCRMALGQLYATGQRYALALEVLGQAGNYFQEVGEPFFAALSIREAARSAQWLGRPQECLALNRQGLALARKAGDLYVSALTVGGIGAIMWMMEGPSKRSEDYYWQGVHLQKELGEKVRYAESLAQVANMPLWREGEAGDARSHVKEALAIAEEQNVAEVRLHIQAEMNTHRLVEGRYEEVLARTAETLASSAIRPGTRCWSNVQRGIALLALNRHAEALPLLKSGLSKMVELDWQGFLSSFLPFFGIVFAERGETERAVELLARGFSQPHASGRLEIDPLIARFRAEMETKLGPERFAAAWARGEKLDPKSTAVAVLQVLDAADWNNPQS